MAAPDTVPCLFLPICFSSLSHASNEALSMLLVASIDPAAMGKSLTGVYSGVLRRPWRAVGAAQGALYGEGARATSAITSKTAGPQPICTTEYEDSSSTLGGSSFVTITNKDSLLHTTSSAELENACEAPHKHKQARGQACFFHSVSCIEQGVRYRKS